MFLYDKQAPLRLLLQPFTCQHNTSVNLHIRQSHFTEYAYTYVIHSYTINYTHTHTHTNIYIYMNYLHTNHSHYLQRICFPGSHHHLFHLLHAIAWLAPRPCNEQCQILLFITQVSVTNCTINEPDNSWQNITPKSIFGNLPTTNYPPNR